jgi:hypothetical protein
MPAQAGIQSYDEVANLSEGSTGRRLLDSRYRGNDTKAAREAEELRRYANMLCLWRVCGSAECRRARSCRGRAYLCGRRNFDTLPQGVRDFFMHFLAAKFSGVDFETFKDEMEDREATAAFFAWRQAAKKGGPR